MLSTKTKEHIRRRFVAGLPRWGSLCGMLVLLGGCVAFTGNALYFVTVQDGAAPGVRLLTPRSDANALLAAIGRPELGPEDEIEWTRSSDGPKLSIYRAFMVPVTADGETKTCTVARATPAELLEQQGYTWSELDRISPEADTPLQAGDEVELQRVELHDYTERLVVPTEVEELPSSLFYRHKDKVQILQQGHDGVANIHWQDVYLDGVWADKLEMGRDVLSEMLPTVQKVYGEGVPVSKFQGPEVVDGVPVEGVAETFTSRRATGYSASPTAKGASGRRLTYGTVAIDPSVIPYGSLMYITSDDGRFVYGYAYAADTGTAMMTGHAFIDLYYETYAESVENAVIPVTVHVLDEETAAKYKEINDAILEADTEPGR